MRCKRRLDRLATEAGMLNANRRDLDVLRGTKTTCFAGYRFGDELAAHYSAADVFVFPSRTDTFGIVMLEANACGLPVAAYPVTGPIDVVSEGVNGALDDRLELAAARALQVPRASCLAHARSQSWRRVAEVLASHLAPIGGPSIEVEAC